MLYIPRDLVLTLIRCMLQCYVRFPPTMPSFSPSCLTRILSQCDSVFRNEASNTTVPLEQCSMTWCVHTLFLIAPPSPWLTCKLFAQLWARHRKLRRIESTDGLAEPGAGVKGHFADGLGNLPGRLHDRRQQHSRPLGSNHVFQEHDCQLVRSLSSPRPSPCAISETSCADSFTPLSFCSERRCVEYCHQKGFIYAGLEYGQVSFNPFFWFEPAHLVLKPSCTLPLKECYCNNSWASSATPDTEGGCNMVRAKVPLLQILLNPPFSLNPFFFTLVFQACVGKLSQTCGGASRLSSYYNSKKATGSSSSSASSTSSTAASSSTRCLSPAQSSARSVASAKQTASKASSVRLSATSKARRRMSFLL